MTVRSERNEAHPEYLGWQMDWPLYVKSPVLTVGTKVFRRGDYLPWAEMNLDPKKISRLYATKQVHHDAKSAKEDGLGDRLGEMSQHQLRSLVQQMNYKLRKDHCAREEDFKKRRCRQSSNLDTQRRFVRQFLSKSPYMGDYFIELRDQILKSTPRVEETQE